MSDEKWFVIAGCNYYPSGGIYEFNTFEEAKKYVLELIGDGYEKKYVKYLSEKEGYWSVIDEGGELQIMVISSLFSGERNYYLL